MPGRVVRQTWRYSPTIDAPARYKPACHYEAFVPDKISNLDMHLDAQLVGMVSEAEHEIWQLNHDGGPAPATLGRLLLRTESIAGYVPRVVEIQAMPRG